MSNPTTSNPNTLSNPILLAQANTDPGFKVPGASSASSSSPASTPAGTLSDTPPPAPGSGIEVAPVAGAPVTDTSSREMAIGAGIMLVLLVIFFFVRNAYSNALVRKRVAPSSAESAGWLLFVGMSVISAAVVLAVMNASKFLTLGVTGTLMLVGIAALIGAFMAGRR